jgi:hypothetical protein
MALSDVIKKGVNAPAPGDLIEGGIGIDVAAGKVYIKNNVGAIVQVGQDTSSLATNNNAIAYALVFGS